MTAPTPDQMRALANKHLMFSPAVDTELVATLRAAADQLEAVREYVSAGEIDDDYGQTVIYTHNLRPLIGLGEGVSNA